MYLLPNRNIRAPQLFDASGLGFKRVADGYEVDVVVPDSPAVSADIRLGDRLIAIDGQRTTELGLAALRERLSRAGKRCELTLQRGQSRLVKNLMLATRL
jgi:C-terminal processing protease CtpA/Prc